jgi:SWI/SNF-related matrix-associated actin-dependent regulator 1 of chromatin subfamily A
MAMETLSQEVTSLQEARQLAAGLFPHQVEGIAFLLGRRRAILADDMGLGKTRQSILAARHTAPEGPWLVVCPASVKLNWAREIVAVAAEARVEVIQGGEPLRAGPSIWTVINYDLLPRYIDSLARVGWRALIFDEAHYLKNHTSQRSRLARRLVAASPADAAVHALTGTPLTNRPRDLFPLLQLVGQPMGRSFLAFAKRYCDAHHNGYGWVTDGASNLEELTVQLRGVMLRRRKEEVLALPPKLRQWLPVNVNPNTGAREMTRVVSLLLANQRGEGAGSRQSSDRLRLLAHLTRARHQLAVAKTASTLELVEDAVEQGEKVLVFSCFDEPVQKIAAKLGEQAVVLTGATPARQRQQLADRFQNDERVRVFVGNILAGGVGLNLTAARQVVFNDLDWVPANHWQAEDRAYRIGQTVTVNVTYMTAPKTLDDFVSSVLQAKSALVGAVVEGKLAPEATRDVLAELELALRRLSPQLADLSPRELTPEEAARLLREAADAIVADTAFSEGAPQASQPVEGIEEAIRLLAQVLAGGRTRRWRIPSSSKPGVSYLLEADDAGDVTCSCPGFQYRGQCSHARDLKQRLVRGGPLPEEYRPD